MFFCRVISQNFPPEIIIAYNRFKFFFYSKKEKILYCFNFFYVRKVKLQNFKTLMYKMNVQCDKCTKFKN